MTPQTQIALELLERFPSAASKTLATIAYSENPSVFASQEAARCLFRRLRGAAGEMHRKNVSHKEWFREPGQPGDPFGKIREGSRHFEDWRAVEFQGPARVLILADVHIPYHDKTALVAALKWGQSNGTDTVLCNGDTNDFFSVSFWEKDPRKRDFKAELDAGREFYQVLREGFPKARIIVKEGNHEERWLRYMTVKAPELLGVEEFDTPHMLHLPKHGIEWVNEKRPIRFGLCNVIHGHEYPFAISNPVNPARGLFLRAKVHCIGSHFHQTSQHNEKNLEQAVVSTWSTGCLCDLHPDYRPLNPWNHGFAFAEVFADGTFQVSNKTIIGGTVY